MKHWRRHTAHVQKNWSGSWRPREQLNKQSRRTSGPRPLPPVRLKIFNNIIDLKSQPFWTRITKRHAHNSHQLNTPNAAPLLLYALASFNFLELLNTERCHFYFLLELILLTQHLMWFWSYSTHSSILTCRNTYR